MSTRKREYMDCHVLCGTVGAHTRTEGCVLYQAPDKLVPGTVEFVVTITVQFTEVNDADALEAEVKEIAHSIDWDTGDGNASWHSFQVAPIEMRYRP